MNRVMYLRKVVMTTKMFKVVLCSNCIISICFGVCWDPIIRRFICSVIHANQVESRMNLAFLSPPPTFSLLFCAEGTIVCLICCFLLVIGT